MLYFFLGKDFSKVRNKTASLINSLLKKNKEASVIKIDADNFNESVFDSTINSQGLFSSKIIIDVKDLGENKLALGFLVKKLKEMKASENIFIWSERGVLADVFKKISSYADKVEKFEEKKGEKEEKFNTFALADALEKKDKKKLWILYQNAIAEDIVPEQIHGVLWWKVKTLIMNKRSVDRKFLNKTADDLITVLHQSRRNNISLEMALEKWILGM